VLAAASFLLYLKVVSISSRIKIKEYILEKSLKTVEGG